MSAESAAIGASPTCTACAEVLRPVAGPGEVDHGTVAGVAAGPVGWECPHLGEHEGHDRRAPTDSEAAAAVADAFDVARRTAIRGTLRCGVCDTPFALPGRRTTRSVTITGEAPAVTVTLDVPVLRCTEDAIDNLPPEALQDALWVVGRIVGASGPEVTG